MATLVVVAALTGAGCAPVADAGSPRVLLLGDSLSVGARDQGALGAKDAAGWTVDAVVGRGTTAGTSALQRDDLSSYDVLVVALGTNDYLDDQATYAARINSLMAVAGTRTKVIWVNVDAGTPKLFPAASGVNWALAAADATRHNLTVADWSTYVGRRSDLDELRAGDGVHYTAAGYNVRARWLEALVA